ncbi:MAG: GFA family protein [Gammaproteobacteria bacterium]|nr:GFA family protein [Gammaproteobacteria bacterium]
MKFQGSCLCKKIRYRCAAELSGCCYCHCSICRKLTGAAFAAYGGISKDYFDWVSGEELLATFSPTPDTKRFSCSVCGSFLVTTHVDDPEYIFISLGSLDGEPNIEMQYHQFTKSKVKWCVIDDRLKKYSAWPAES